MGSLCAEEGGCYSPQINHAVLLIVEEKAPNSHFSLSWQQQGSVLVIYAKKQITNQGKNSRTQTKRILAE